MPITIPRELTKSGELVVIPRREYENLLALKQIREFQPTAAQKRALRSAERNLQLSRTLSLNAALKELGFAS